MNNLSLFIITAYSIPNSSHYGPKTTAAQQNKILGKCNSTDVLIEQFLLDLVEYIHLREDDSDILLMGNMNQLLFSNRIRSFFFEIGVYDILSFKYDIPLQY